MNHQDPELERLPSRETCADAAAWLTSLQDPDRTADVEQGFRLWLAEHPDHARAFEMATETWERSARLMRRPSERLAQLQRPGVRVTFARAAAVIGTVAALAVLATAYYFHNDAAVTTTIGEQRALTLEDGTRVYLNTGTRAIVDYTEKRRHIDLKEGEALFEVARDTPNRPFVVTAGNRTITALGTSFVVRQTTQVFSVTLMDGKVAVASESPAKTTLARQQVLMPGQRLTFTGAQSPTLDRPLLEKVTAWQRGQVAFDATPLSEAVTEMNRYSTTPLVVQRPEAEELRVSGVFRAGDNHSFARAMADTYRLTWVEEPQGIVLSGVPIMPRE